MALLFLLPDISATAQTDVMVVGPEAALITPVFGRPSLSQEAPRAAAGADGQSLVVWMDARFHLDVVMGTRVAADGDVLDPAGIPIAILDADASLQELDVLWDGSDYLVVWASDNGLESPPGTIRATRVSAAGEISAVPPVEIAHHEYLSGLSVAFDGTNYLVAWGNCDLVDDTCNHDLVGVLLDSTANPVDEPLIVTGVAGSQVNPDVMWNGMDFVVVWDDLREAAGGVFGARVTDEGANLDPGGIQLTTGRGEFSSPELAWSGEDLILVWEGRSEQSSALSGGFLSETLQFVTGPFTISPSGNLPAVASDGNRFLVTWGGCTYAGCVGDIHARTVLPDGPMGSSAQRISSTGSNGAPVTVWGGSGYLVAWENSARDDSEGPIKGRVTEGDEFHAPEFLVSSAPNDQTAFDSVRGEGRTLIVWHDSRDRGGIYGKFLEGVGPLGEDEFLIARSPGGVGPPRVAWNGRRFIVVWDQYPGADLRYQLLEPDGTATEPYRFAPEVVSTGGAKFNHEVVSDGRAFLIVWEKGDSGKIGLQKIRNDSSQRLGYRGRTIPGIREASAPEIGWDGDRYLLAYQDACEVRAVGFRCKTRVVATFLNRRAEPLREARYVSSAVSHQLTPKIEAGEGRFLLAWEKVLRNGPDSLIGKMVGSGEIRRGDNFLIATDVASSMASGLWDGERFFVSWLDCEGDCWSADIAATLISPDGSVDQPQYLTEGGEASPARFGSVTTAPGSVDIFYGIVKPRTTGVSARGVHRTVGY